MGRAPARGLADVVAASTELSEIDGQSGRLWDRSYGVSALAKLGGLEEVAFLLQRGALGAR